MGETSFWATMHGVGVLQERRRQAAIPDCILTSHASIHPSPTDRAAYASITLLAGGPDSIKTAQDAAIAIMHFASVLSFGQPAAAAPFQRAIATAADVIQAAADAGVALDERHAVELVEAAAHADPCLNFNMWFGHNFATALWLRLLAGWSSGEVGDWQAGLCSCHRFCTDGAACSGTTGLPLLPEYPTSQSHLGLSLPAPLVAVGGALPGGLVHPGGPRRAAVQHLQAPPPGAQRAGAHGWPHRRAAGPPAGRAAFAGPRGHPWRQRVAGQLAGPGGAPPRRAGVRSCAAQGGTVQVQVAPGWRCSARSARC